MAAFPNKVGVLGGGRMGNGIAHAFLINGASAVIVERDPQSAEVAREQLDKSIIASVERGVIDNADVVIERSLVSVDRADFADCDLVIEAIPEILDLKIEALTAIEQIIAPDAVLASNTSSISIDELAGHLQRPAQFLGLHFFNPVPASKLVEVVMGAGTDAALADTARGWIEGLKKTPIVVKDSPGFASSRLGVAIALEAMRMVEEGVASAQDIDLAMELGYRHPMGPLKTTDIVGLDVRLGIAEYLNEHLTGDRFEVPQILRDKVAAGELGRKTGKGFYDWTEGK